MLMYVVVTSTYVVCIICMYVPRWLLKYTHLDLFFIDITKKGRRKRREEEEEEGKNITPL